MEDKICKKCGEDFKPQKGLINYCSLQCRNSRTLSDETKKKISISIRSSKKFRDAMKDRKGICKKYNKIQNKKKLLNTSKEKKRLKKIINNRKEEILSADFDTLKFERRRERIIYEQNGKCFKCKLDKWNNENIPLELDHIDGNNKNNDRNNLEMLCPNCHAQTKTWRGRNKKNNTRNNVSDTELLNKLITNNWNIRQSLLFFNMAAKGNNYKRCNKLKEEYENIL